VNPPFGYFCEVHNGEGTILSDIDNVVIDCEMDIINAANYIQPNISLKGLPGNIQITVPLRKKGTVSQLRDFMCEFFGYTDKDNMQLKHGKKRLNWDDLISELNLDDPNKQLSLFLPNVKGREKIFMELDIHGHRVLYNEDFDEACMSLGVHLKNVDTQRVWRYMDPNLKGVTFKKFQEFICPEATIPDFVQLLHRISEFSEQDFLTFTAMPTQFQNEWVRAHSRQVSNAARLKKLQNARSTVSLFACFDVYMSGRISPPLLHEGLHLAGCKVSAIQAQFLLKSVTREFMDAADFKKLCGNRDDCDLNAFIERVQARLEKASKQALYKVARGMYRTEVERARAKKVWEKSQQTPEQILAKFLRNSNIETGNKRSARMSRAKLKAMSKSNEQKNEQNRRPSRWKLSQANPSE